MSSLPHSYYPLGRLLPRWRAGARRATRACTPSALTSLCGALALGCTSGGAPLDGERVPGRHVNTELDFEPAPLIPTDRADAAAALDAPHALGGGSAPASLGPEPPALAASALATSVYEEPDRGSQRLGYVRLGGVLRRAERPTPGRGCSKFWYAVQPRGYVCTAEATLDLRSPLLRATRRRPDLEKPLPYSYGFVRAAAPEYLRIPSHTQQLESEPDLPRLLDAYEKNRLLVERVSLGANDVPLDEAGMARLGAPLPHGLRLGTQLEPNELYGGGSGDGRIPFWLEGGRQLPHLSERELPESALFAERVPPGTGVPFVDSFVTTDAGFRRGFALTVDLRLIPTTHLEPESASQFHGVELGASVELPFAIVVRRGAQGFQLIRGRDEARPAGAVPHRALIPMSGSLRFKAGRRFYQTGRDPRLWLAASDVAFFASPPALPSEAAQGKKWIDVSLAQQALVLYEGEVPRYATLISSARERLGDAETGPATAHGSFAIGSKHVTETLRIEGGSTLAPGVNGAVHSELELRDVPWVQHLDGALALRAAYWHDDFGVPRSGASIDLAPIDARVVFNWTEPALPEGWHGFNVEPAFGPGTAVILRE